MIRRFLPVVIAVSAIVLAVAGPAAAHVTVNPSEAPQGGFTKLTFRVPNEDETASTISVQVSFPAENPVRLRVKPVPGWTVDVKTRTSGDDTSTESITWTGGSIKPGEFQEFEVSGGPLPEADELVIPAVQTYDNGEVVRWIEIAEDGAEEPEHPAPVLKLVAAADGEDAHGGGGDDAAVAPASASVDVDDDDGGSDAIAIAALVAALAALAVSVGTFVTSRRTTT